MCPNVGHEWTDTQQLSGSSADLVSFACFIRSALSSDFRKALQRKIKNVKIRDRGGKRRERRRKRKRIRERDRRGESWNIKEKQ